MSRLGIDGFDQLVPEEIPKPGTVLLLVPPAEEKELLAAQFVLEGLRNSDSAILIASEAGVRDLVRRLGNMGFDTEKAIGEQRLIPLDWGRAALKNGAPAGLDAVKSTLSSVAAAKTQPNLRIVLDLSGTLPESLGALPLDDLSRAIAELTHGLGALSLIFAPRVHGVAPALVEAFDLVLDLRPLKPTGFGLAVVAIAGTPLPRSHMNLIESNGRLVLEASGKAAGPAGDVECPVCKFIIPASAAVCPKCQSPRPVRQRGEPEVLDYIEALERRVGRPGVPLQPSGPLHETPAPEAVAAKEAVPSRPQPSRRGLTNGLARQRRIRTPAMPQGRVNGVGRTDGLTNGIGHTNGLTNGLVTLRRGLTNGLTNGNGFTNGLGAKRFRSESGRRVWRVYLIPFLAVALLAIPFLIPDPANMNTFGIDGSFGDWTRVAPLATDPALPGPIDLTSVGTRMSDDRLFGYIEARDALLQGSSDGLGMDALRMFIDTDGETSSGYRVGDLGAEALVEIMGARGAVVSASAFTFGGADPANWTAWAPAGGVLAAIGRGPQANRIEFSIGSLILPSGGPTSPNLRASFEAFAFDGREDSSGFAIGPGRPALVVEQQSIAPSSLSAEDDLLEIHLRAPLGPVVLQSVRIEATGNVPKASLESAIIRDASKVPLAMASADANGRYTFDLGSSYTVGAAGTTLRVSAEAGEAVPGTLGLAIKGDSDIRAANTTVSLSTLPSDRDVTYVGDVPSGVVIDGGFEDWPLPAADAIGEETTRGRADIDLAAYDSIRSGNAVAVYARAVGGILQGGLVPVSNRRNQPAVSSASNLKGVPRAVRGEDTLRVFIDSDADSSTGYAPSIGADWLVEIVGRHGVARTSVLSRFTGSNPETWSWTPTGAPDVAIGTRQLELVAALTSAPATGTRIVIDLQDWMGGSDRAGGTTRSTTRSPGGASLDAGDYSVDLPADVHSSEGVGIRTDLFSATWSLVDIVATASGEGVALPVSASPLVIADSYASYQIRVGDAPAFMRYAFGPGALKEEFILLAPPTDSAKLESLTLRFSLVLSGGASLLTPSDFPATRAFGQSGDYVIVVDGRAVARFPAPFAVDGDARVTGCAYDTPGAEIFDIVCPASALAGARYPVTIDPSTTFTLSNNGPNGQAVEDMGWSVASGDLNGDGYLDVLTGAPLNDKAAVDAGMAYIFLGPFSANSSTPNVNLKGNGTTTYQMGYGVGVGDFNNDGIDDAVVGQQNHGPALVFYGRASWPTTVTTANVSFAEPSGGTDGSFGRTFAVGNFDGSGGSDLVIGRPFYPDFITNPHGRGYLFFSPFTAYETTADLIVAPLNDTKGHFGVSMASGRIDSDTKDDLLVGETTVTAGTNTYGRISLFKGSSLTGSGTKVPDKTIIHPTSGSQFGSAVSVGRLNGDTYSDVLVGAPALASSNGAAYIFLAKSDGSGLDTNQSASVTLSSQTSLEKFGSSVLIGDAFGDGTNDAVVGAEAYGALTGRVYVFNDPLSDQTVDETLTGQAGEKFGHALAGDRKANDPTFLLLIGGPAWDDIGQGEIDAGRTTVASIPEFSDVGFVGGLTIVVLLLVRRRRLAAQTRVP